MPLFPDTDQHSLYIARSDPLQLLGTFSKHGFELDGLVWPSAEHYFQGMKTEDARLRAQIAAADHPKKARRLGRSRRLQLRDDWKQVRTTVMTRALYIKCRAHPEVAEALLATGDQRLVESSAYDYFWGCGRDRRGTNQYGKVLMSVRQKLRQEAGEP